MISSFKVSAPASIGNFIVGFDHIGAAVNWPSDEIYVKPTHAHNEVRITKIMGGQKKLTKALDENIVGIAITSYIEAMGEPLPFGLDLQIKKCIGIGTGLGSSASSATAAVMAINEALKRPLEKRDLLIHANKAEAFASGSMHADNTAPALFGGIQLILKWPVEFIEVIMLVGKSATSPESIGDISALKMIGILTVFPSIKLTASILVGVPSKNRFFGLSVVVSKAMVNKVVSSGKVIPEASESTHKIGSSPVSGLFVLI